MKDPTVIPVRLFKSAAIKILQSSTRQSPRCSSTMQTPKSSLVLNVYSATKLLFPISPIHGGILDVGYMLNTVSTLYTYCCCNYYMIMLSWSMLWPISWTSCVLDFVDDQIMVIEMLPTKRGWSSSCHPRTQCFYEASSKDKFLRLHFVAPSILAVVTYVPT